MVVPGHHHLVRPDDRGDRVGGHDLAGLVEDHHVEQPGGGQHLAHHQRRHRPARLDREQHVGRLVEQAAQRQVAAAQRGLLADDPGLQRVPVLGVTRCLGPGLADPGPVRGQVLHVPVPEVVGDLVQRVAALGRVARVTDPDLIQDRGVPGVVEGGRGQVAARLPAGQLVQQRAQPHPVEPQCQLVQPGQLPRRVLVRSQRPDHPLDRALPVPGTAGLGQRRDERAQRGQLAFGLREQAGQPGVARGQPGRAGLALAEFLPLCQLAGGRVEGSMQVLPGRPGLGGAGPQRPGLGAQPTPFEQAEPFPVTGRGGE